MHIIKSHEERDGSMGRKATMFAILATTLIAFFIFKEVISKKLRLAIVLVTVASIILGLEGTGSFSFNAGSLLVLGACICWGFENNCTKMLSSKSSISYPYPCT